MTDSQRRQKYYQAWKRGLFAEEMAKLFLFCKGYAVIAQRYKTPVGEIDLIMRQGKYLVFVEVKARAGNDAVYALQSRQRERIVKAAKWFLQRHPALRELQPRFDLVTLAPLRWPRHLVNAWLAEE